MITVATLFARKYRLAFSVLSCGVAACATFKTGIGGVDPDHFDAFGSSGFGFETLGE